MAATDGRFAVSIHQLMLQVLQQLQPTDIILHYHKPDEYFDNVVAACHQSVGKDSTKPLLQILSVEKIFEPATVPANLPHRYRLLNIVLLSMADQRILLCLERLFQRVPDYYVHTTLVLIPDCKNAKNPRPKPNCNHLASHNEAIVVEFFPFADHPAGAILITATIDNQQLINKIALSDATQKLPPTIGHVSQNLANWTSAGDTSLVDTIGSYRWLGAKLPYAERIAAVRDRMPVKLKRVRLTIRYNMSPSSGQTKQLNTPAMLEALDRHFDTCVVSEESNRTFSSRQCALKPTKTNVRPRSVEFGQFFGRKNQFRMVPLSRRAFVMFAPNWWSKRSRSINSDMMLLYLGSTVALLAALIWLRRIDPDRRIRPLSHLSIDTFGRMLCIGQSDDRRPDGQRRGFGYWFGLMASVWGLLHSGTMTGELFGWTVGAILSPVFEKYDDVLQHKWLPIVCDDGIMMAEIKQNQGINASRLGISAMHPGNSPRKSLISFLNPATSVTENSEYLNMKHKANNSAVFRMIMDSRFSHPVSFRTYDTYLWPRLSLFQRRFVESGLIDHIEMDEQFVLRLGKSSWDQIPTDNPDNSDENITAIWFFVQLSICLYGLASVIFLVECSVGSCFYDRVTGFEVNN